MKNPDKVSVSPKLKTSKTESSEHIRQTIKDELKSLGLPEIPEVLEHLVVLEQNSHFNDDSRMIMRGIENILDHERSVQLKPIERKQLLLATHLSDIGKSFSLAVAKLFSVENIRNVEQTVSTTLQDSNYFPGESVDVQGMLAELEKVGVSANMSMREFWDKHAFWTKDILDRHSDVINKKVRIIAGSHHIDKIDLKTGKPKINPYKIDITDVEQVSNELKFSIFLLMAVDKYQALIRRSKKNHGDAVRELRRILGGYDGDAIMGPIIKTIEELGATDSLFKESK